MFGTSPADQAVAITIRPPLFEDNKKKRWYFVLLVLVIASALVFFYTVPMNSPYSEIALLVCTISATIVCLLVCQQCYCLCSSPCTTDDDDGDDAV